MSASDASRPWGSPPRSATIRRKAPAPQPTSRTRAPGSSGTRSSAASYVGSCRSSLSAQSAGRAPHNGPQRSALPCACDYTEPKRLAKLGYLAARPEPGKTRERTVYSLTDKGFGALRAYARTPVHFTPVKSDPLLRLLLCDLVGEQVTRTSMLTLRGEVAEILERLDEAEARAEELPHRRKYLLLVTAFLRDYLQLHLELVDTIEREFGEASAGDGAEEAASA